MSQEFEKQPTIFLVEEDDDTRPILKRNLREQGYHVMLRMAVEARCPGDGLLHHSDRGVQYAALDYQELLTRHRIVPSMSRRANCDDKAVVESFFATLEWELIERSEWRTRDEARLAIFEYIECWYNPQRRHASLGYMSPAEYEQQLLSQAA